MFTRVTPASSAAQLLAWTRQSSGGCRAWRLGPSCLWLHPGAQPGVQPAASPAGASVSYKQSGMRLSHQRSSSRGGHSWGRSRQNWALPKPLLRPGRQAGVFLPTPSLPPPAFPPMCESFTGQKPPKKMAPSQPSLWKQQAIRSLQLGHIWNGSRPGSDPERPAPTVLLAEVRGAGSEPVEKRPVCAPGRHENSPQSQNKAGQPQPAFPGRLHRAGRREAQAAVH